MQMIHFFYYYGSDKQEREFDLKPGLWGKDSASAHLGFRASGTTHVCGRPKVRLFVYQVPIVQFW